MKPLAIAGLLLASTGAIGSELIYTPTNPAFGGNPINGNYLLSNAQAQDTYKNPDLGEGYSTPSDLDRFTSSLQSRLLSQLLTDVGSGNSGSIETDAFIVDLVDIDGVLTVTITDRETNEVTEIVVSGLNPGN
ncbi:curli assembly protein CsgF [Simiduia agarivorans]|uniref:Curli production assembly/transport component CsgF n=1 Tax=Simiduia agarivorans (strain DSM 21679 / JCM 13881 / BCRC 17597 / SA1) TaxID=1117647 RepID=K4KIK7_SIMAS|nr:curli assembly protein CsgF [Simiduia agarivorans]AFU98984.1 curli fiber protein CsgF [Simiduia agarivorans SA1 = DSM 21679]